MAAGANGLGRRVFEGRGESGLGGKERQGPLMGVPRSHVDIRNCNVPSHLKVDVGDHCSATCIAIFFIQIYFKMSLSTNNVVNMM